MKTSRHTGAFLILGAGSLHIAGIMFVYAYPLVLARMETTWDPMWAAFPALIFTIAGGLWAPIAGRLLDAQPKALAIPMGLFAIIAGFGLWSLTSSVLVLMMIVATLISFGAQLAGAQGGPHLLRTAYQGNQPRAQFLASIGLSFAALVVPLIDWLIGPGVGSVGLLLSLAIVLFCLSAIAMACIHVAGATTDHTVTRWRIQANTERRPSFSGTPWKTRAMYTGLLFGGLFGSIGAFILHFGSQMAQANASNLLLGGGGFILAIATGGLVSRIGLSLIANPNNVKTVLVGLVVWHFIASACVLLGGSALGVWGSVAVTVLFGVSVSGTLSIVPIIAADISDRASYGAVLGAIRFWSLFSNVFLFILLSAVLQLAPSFYASSHLFILAICGLLLISSTRGKALNVQTNSSMGS